MSFGVTPALPGDQFSNYFPDILCALTCYCKFIKTQKKSRSERAEKTGKADFVNCRDLNIS